MAGKTKKPNRKPSIRQEKLVAATESVPDETFLLPDVLTTKQRLFVESYLSGGFNATEAARVAGYKGKEHTLHVVGYENLRKPEIAAIIADRINEAAMSANEVMARLSAMARGDLQDVTDEDGKFDFEKARRAKKTGLLKKLKRKSMAKKVNVSTDDEESETLETSIVHEEVEFEMYSAHEALRDLGKYHTLFNERAGNFTLNFTPEQMAALSDDELDRLISRVSQRRI